MGRLIDCDKLCTDLLERWNIADKNREDQIRWLMADVVTPIVACQPTVDAVPVVRCRECRWWHDWSGECYAKEAQGFGHLWEADDYCSYGERKDGDHHEG